MEYLTLKLDLNTDELQMLCGNLNRNLSLLQELYETEMTVRDDKLRFFSKDEDKFIVLANHINRLVDHIRINKEMPDETVIRQLFYELNNNSNTDWRSEIAGYTHGGKPIRFKTISQYELCKAVENNDITFSIGPAGTGKTYLSVLLACKAYKKGEIRKIILTRPAVEAGESLGFLPGDLKEKVDPYLMPLYDALYELLGEEQVSKMLEKNAIEIVPLAFVRGRTFSNAFVIVDEAQNTTDKQMLMILTRLGFNSKMIINGDITQIDLNISKNRCGLLRAKETLQGIRGIAFASFSQNDVVRHPLIEMIIKNFSI